VQRQQRTVSLFYRTGDVTQPDTAAYITTRRCPIGWQAGSPTLPLPRPRAPTYNFILESCGTRAVATSIRSCTQSNSELASHFNVTRVGQHSVFVWRLTNVECVCVWAIIERGLGGLLVYLIII